jgi:hypothetical protein
MRVLGLLLPFVVVASCGGSDSYTLGNICTQVGAAECARAVECGVATSVSACKTDFQGACCQDAAACGTKVPDDQKSAIKSATKTCADSYDNYSCDQLYAYDGLTPECYDLIYGTAAVIPNQLSTPLAPSATKPALKKLDVRKIGKLTYERLRQITVPDDEAP